MNIEMATEWVSARIMEAETAKNLSLYPAERSFYLGKENAYRRTYIHLMGGTFPE